MAILTGQPCLALVAQALLVLLNCMSRCQSFVTTVASGCGPVMSLMFEKRLGSPPREQQLRSSHLRADVDTHIADC
jgi:hypothetical protein